MPCFRNDVQAILTEFHSLFVVVTFATSNGHPSAGHRLLVRDHDAAHGDIQADAMRLVRPPLVQHDVGRAQALGRFDHVVELLEVADVVFVDDVDAAGGLRAQRA